MATLILGTVGRIVAGPVGAIVGTLLGGGVDRAVLGGGRAREQGRIGNPAVQSATYGEPIPVIVGRMRAAGNLIWTSGIRESASTTGGGKRSGPATTGYRYAASFAVGLAGRPIAGVGRIWADGKLVRDAEGRSATPMTMRLHLGGEDQPVDPLIAAAEGVASAPAYHGLAYAVFEDLPLADYGNRIPNLTFEIIADTAAPTAGDVIAGLAGVTGLPALTVAGAFPQLSGYIAARAGSLADGLAPLLAVADAAIIDDDGLRVEGRGRAVQAIAADAIDARRPTEARPPERQRRAAADSRPAGVELAFYDTSRDYQPGLQRARRSAAARIDHQSLAAAMTPMEAKAVAADLLARGRAARMQRRVRLAWRHLHIAPGAMVTLADAVGVWRVREARFENFIVHLDLESCGTASDTGGPAADGGRSLPSESQAVGATVLRVLDLPALPGDLPSQPRLWIAGNGAGAGWRRAGVSISTDGGEGFVNAGTLEGGTVMGTASTALAAADAAVWDMRSAVEIELLSDRDWLEPRSRDAVLAGANLAMIGDELVQFCGAEAIGPRRFRLHSMLRGRRGTEVATAGHVASEAFVLIDPARMLAVDLPLELLGRPGLARAAGAGDAMGDKAFQVGGRALRPLSPVHLRARRSDGDIEVRWIRRSRTGYGWTDFVDAPLSEDAEQYRVEVMIDGRQARQAMLDTPRYRYTATDLAGDGGGSMVTFRVRQWSASVGPGEAASVTIHV